MFDLDSAISTETTARATSYITWLNTVHRDLRAYNLTRTEQSSRPGPEPSSAEADVYRTAMRTPRMVSIAADTGRATPGCRAHLGWS